MTDDTNTAATVQADNSAPSLTLSDLVAARNVAKIALDGKFFKRKDEAEGVEAIYNKLNNFVTYADEMNAKKAEVYAAEAKTETTPEAAPSA